MIANHRANLPLYQASKSHSLPVGLNVNGPQGLPPTIVINNLLITCK